MKKITLFIAAIVLMMNISFAQDELKSKNGIPILPEAGDCAIGVGASSFLFYFGNLFNGTTNNGLTLNYPNTQQALYGKYFMDEKTAIRVMLRIGYASNKTKNFLDNQTSTETPPAQVTDVRKISSSNITLGAGYEMRTGKGRIQGFYGGQFMFSLAGGKTTYEYGNSFTGTYTTPLTTDFSTMTSSNAFSRTVSSKSGSTLGIGLGGFLGAEYFIFPKFSIGGEFGWGLSFTNTGTGTFETEAWDGTSSSVETTTTETAGGSSFGVDTSPAGSIFVLFHF